MGEQGTLAQTPRPPSASRAAPAHPSKARRGAAHPANTSPLPTPLGLRLDRLKQRGRRHRRGRRRPPPLTLAGADEKVAVGGDAAEGQVHHGPRVPGARQGGLSHGHGGGGDPEAGRGGGAAGRRRGARARSLGRDTSPLRPGRKRRRQRWRK